MVDLVPKKTSMALVQVLKLGGSAKTCFKNANLGLPLQTRVESASSTLCLLIHLGKQNTRRNVKRREGEKKVLYLLNYVSEYLDLSRSYLKPMPRTSHS